MQKDWHTTDTVNGKSVPFLFGSFRPKVWLRRAPVAIHHAIREYILSRGTKAEAGSLKNLKERL